jgi:hypothetical protein
VCPVDPLAAENIVSIEGNTVASNRRLAQGRATRRESAVVARLLSTEPVRRWPARRARPPRAMHDL